MVSTVRSESVIQILPSFSISRFSLSFFFFAYSTGIDLLTDVYKGKKHATYGPGILIRRIS
ncbi:hypothetical protein BDW59DRAFT_69045 [Aspergillus cavernicola]|uniref:Uncharacterized protein n=1 Tax=Aspergillus cavernicola TaxID=176166 RepID=A0ABR4IE18_9EURO